MEFTTTVGGIPCICRVTDYQEGKPWSQDKHGELSPPEDEVFEFDILDRKRYPAAWLEKKLTDKDRERIFEEFQEAVIEYEREFLSESV